jgi:hypothetical protein
MNIAYRKEKARSKNIIIKEKNIKAYILERIMKKTS